MRRLFVLLAVGFLLAGCGGDDESAPTTTATEEAGVTVEGVRVIKVIVVHESEYRLTPSTVKVDRLGYYGIKAVNEGRETHALELEGHGIEKKTGDIAPSESKTVAVFLKTSGKYELYCPIDGHRDKGMKGTLTVP